MVLDLICPSCGQTVSLDSKKFAKVDYLACRQCKRPVPDKLLTHLKQFCWHLAEKPDRDPHKWVITFPQLSLDNQDKEVGQ